MVSVDFLIIRNVDLIQSCKMKIYSVDFQGKKGRSEQIVLFCRLVIMLINVNDPLLLYFHLHYKKPLLKHILGNIR